MFSGFCLVNDIHIYKTCIIQYIKRVSARCNNKQELRQFFFFIIYFAYQSYLFSTRFAVVKKKFLFSLAENLFSTQFFSVTIEKLRKKYYKCRSTKGGIKYTMLKILNYENSLLSQLSLIDMTRYVNHPNFSHLSAFVLYTLQLYSTLAKRSGLQ